MHKFIVSLAAASMMLVAGSAFAENVTGTISAIDADAQIITLDNGVEYKAPEDMDVSGLDVGASVEIEFEVVDEENLITDLNSVE